MSWLTQGRSRPGQVCLVHGEPENRDALARRIEAETALPVLCPQYREMLEI